MISPSIHASRPQQSLALARCLVFLDEPNAADLIAGVARREWIGEPRVRVSPMLGLKPAYATISYDSTVMLVLNGVRTVEQAQFVGTGYFAPPDIGNQAGASVAFGLPADLILTDLLANDEWDKRGFVIGGHSYGGGIAACMARRLNTPDLGGRVSYTTFGSPKPGNEAFARSVEGIPKARWMNPRDPVPKVFPSVDEAPLLYLAKPLGLIRISEQYVQTNGGLELLDGGGVASTVFPSGTLRIAEVDLARWLRALTLDEASGHRLELYIANLAAYVASLPPVVAATDPPMGVGQHTHIDPARDVRRAMNAVLKALSARASRQGAATPFVPEGNRFVAVKTGGLYGVMFNGAMIAWGIKKRRATHMAFLANSFIKEYLKAGIAYPENFEKSLKDFLASAALGDGVIRPTLQTGITEL